MRRKEEFKSSNSDAAVEKSINSARPSVSDAALSLWREFPVEHGVKRTGRDCNLLGAPPMAATLESERRLG